MKALIAIGLLLSPIALAATPKDQCLNGSYVACKRIFSKYGSQTDRRGAAELFTTACLSQKVKMKCEIASSEKSQTMKKVLEMMATESDHAVFVINGPKVDKIYKVSAAN